MLLALVLAASTPVHVVAVHGPQTGAALARLLKTSASAIDASELHAYLMHPSGVLPLQDFEAFTAAPVPQWPADSAEVWKQGVAHCSSVVGPPPWASTKMPSAMACGTRLSMYLWQQFASLKKAARVFELDVTVDDRRGKVEVRGSVWEPNSRDVLTFDEFGPVAKQDELIDQVLTALIAKKGKPQARNVVTEIASAVLGDPFAGQPVASTPIALPKTCAALPKSLTFAQKSILADSLSARWKPADAKGESVPCTLNFNEHTETLGGAMSGTVVTVMTTLLTCSANVVTVELARDAGKTQNRTLVDVVSERLVQNLATKLCK